MKDFAYSFYRSAAWKKCRQSYIDKRILIDGGLCEECHERAGYIVHHRTMLTPANIRDPEVSLNHANLEFVCKKCHDNFEGHFYQKSPKKLTKCEFDAFGMPMPPLKFGVNFFLRYRGGKGHFLRTIKSHKGGVI